PGRRRYLLAALSARAVPAAEVGYAAAMERSQARAVPASVVATRLTVGTQATAGRRCPAAVRGAERGGRGARHGGARRGAGRRRGDGAAAADHGRRQGHLARLTRLPDPYETVETPVPPPLAAEDARLGRHGNEQYA